MYKLVCLSPLDLPSFDSSPALPDFDWTLLTTQQADLHLIVEQQQQIVARCSLWWTQAPPQENERLGVIGHYAAENDQAAALLLDGACQRLTEAGCTRAVGPMDGNTWRRYRFVTEQGPEAPYFMEPVNPPEWPVQWHQAGFRPIADYTSSLTDDLEPSNERILSIRQRLTAAQIQIRPLRATDFTAELQRIYQVAHVAFKKNYLYTPLSETDFLTQYLPVQPLIDGDYCLIAEADQQPVGFVFSIPDMLRRPSADTLIIKTLAVLPGRRYAGLGALLMDEVHQTARRKGIKRVIHALMHKSNHSTNLKSDSMHVFRHYTLFGRTLEQP